MIKLPDISGTVKTEAGIYVHIPFCERKCFYCDFYSVADRNIEPDYFHAVGREIELVSRGADPSPWGDTVFDTIYLGGGTPSWPHPDHIRNLLEKINACFTIAPHAEITMEVNPGTVDFEKFLKYRAWGVNRINIGIQSFFDSQLGFLKRIHRASDGIRAFESARKAGFQNLGLDIIYGLPGQGKESLMEELKRAVSLEPEHISCYMLTYEEGTPLDQARIKGTVIPAEDNLVGEHFMTVSEFLESMGYVHYEISNFAKSEKFRSRHNMKYWNFSTYLGFGPSAHSYLSETNRRYWNVSDIGEYIKRLKHGELPVEEVEDLSREQRMVEAVFLGLRKRDGISIGEFDRRFDADFKGMFNRLIHDLVGRGEVELTQSHCRLTKKGFLLADGIAALFTDLI